MSGGNGATKVAVLTDCSILRAGFEALLQSPEFGLVGFASSEAELVELIDASRPDVVIVPTGDGALESCGTISRHFPALPVLVVSAGLDDGSVRDAIDAGANGFLFKDVGAGDFQSAVRRLVAGESVLDPRVAGRVIAWATNRAVEIKGEALSSREIEVLRLVAQGEPNKRIARRIGITENTVKTYLRRAYRKLGCHTRSAATAAAVRQGLL